MDEVMKVATERQRTARVEFTHHRGMFETSREILATTMLEGSQVWNEHHLNHQTRELEIRQAMTYLGRTQVQLIAGPADLDGVNGKYRASEGWLLLENMRKDLKWLGGMSSADSAATINRADLWDWADNQVTLLMNMLRFVLLRRIASVTEEGLFGELPVIEDEGFVVDPNCIWDTDYPMGGAMTWPVAGRIEGIPRFLKLETYAPPEGYSVVDLTMLEEEEARFVLLMCCPWTRQSRYRIDFSVPQLTSHLYYRAKENRTILNLDDWFFGLNQRKEAPELPTWQVAKSALDKYVAVNKLVSQMNVARNLIMRMYCQYLPVTVDGAVWLHTEWVATLPRFKAVRNRFAFLTGGNSASVAMRGLTELAYYEGDLEAYNFSGICVCQSLFYGLAIRSLRTATELRPEHVISMQTFCTPGTLTSSAIAETISALIPLIGMTGIGVMPMQETTYREVQTSIWVKKLGREYGRAREPVYKTRSVNPVAETPHKGLDLKDIPDAEKAEVEEFLDMIEHGKKSGIYLGILESQGFTRLQKYYVLEQVIRYPKFRKIFASIRNRSEEHAGELLWDKMVDTALALNRSGPEVELTDNLLPPLMRAIYRKLFQEEDELAGIEPFYLPVDPNIEDSGDDVAGKMNGSKRKGKEKEKENESSAIEADPLPSTSRSPQPKISVSPMGILEDMDKDLRAGKCAAEWFSVPPQPTRYQAPEMQERRAGEEAARKITKESAVERAKRVRDEMNEERTETARQGIVSLLENLRTGTKFPLVEAFQVDEKKAQEEPVVSPRINVRQIPRGTVPTLSDAERAEGGEIVAMDLDHWPLPGIPVYVKQALGPRHFRLFDTEYDLRVSDLNRTPSCIRGDVMTVWKLLLMLRMMGWTAEVNMFSTAATRRCFRYTSDGTVPLPPGQDIDRVGDTVSLRKLEKQHDGVSIPDILTADKSLVIKIEVMPLDEYICGDFHQGRSRQWVS